MRVILSAGVLQMSLRPLLSIPLVVLAVGSWPALGQTAAPPSEPTPMPAIAAHKCVAPEYPGHNASKLRVDAFNRDYKAYGECMKKYVEDANNWIKAATETINKAIDEYNKYTEELKKKIEAD
jgi:hypothetical protein